MELLLVPRAGGLAVQVGAAVLVTLSLLLRRRLPLLVAVVATATMVAPTAVTGADTPLATGVAVLVATWSLARSSTTEVAMAGGVVVFAGTPTHAIALADFGPVDIAISQAFFVLAWCGGVVFRARHEAVLAAQSEADRVTREHDAHRVDAGAEHAAIAASALPARLRGRAWDRPLRGRPWPYRPLDGAGLDW